MKKLLAMMMCLSVLWGCSNEKNPTEKPQNNEQEYVFEFEGTQMKMNADAEEVINQLGDPENYFEETSCAFEGLDKIYSYSGFELKTYPLDDKDKISEIQFVDDTVSTKEGVCIGENKAKMESVYGTQYQENNGSYVYTTGKSQLEFNIVDDEIVAITYIAIVE